MNKIQYSAMLHLCSLWVLRFLFIVKFDDLWDLRHFKDKKCLINITTMIKILKWSFSYTNPRKKNNMRGFLSSNLLLLTFFRDYRYGWWAKGILHWSSIKLQKQKWQNSPNPCGSLHIMLLLNLLFLLLLLMSLGLQT